MDLENPDDFSQLASLIKGFGNDTRLALLLGFYHGYTANEIAVFLDMTRGGLQNNISKMVESDLVYRPSADEAPTYALTPIGTLFARIFDAHASDLLQALELLTQTEEQIEQELRESPLADGLSQAEMKRLVHTKKWADAGEEISELCQRPPLTRLFDLLEEEPPLQVNTAAVITQLAHQDPDAIRPSLPEAAALAASDTLDTRAQANLLLAITKVIKDQPKSINILLPDTLSILRRTIFDIIDEHLDIVIDFAQVLLGALSIDQPEQISNREQIFAMKHRLSGPKQSTIFLHHLLRSIADAFEEQGKISTRELAPYTTLDVQPWSINKSKTDHERAITELAPVLAPHVAEIPVPEARTAPYNIEH